MKFCSLNAKDEAFREFLESGGRQLVINGENMEDVRKLFDAVYDAKYAQDTATQTESQPFVESDESEDVVNTSDCKMTQTS